MTNYRRFYSKGGTYFFTVVTQERRPIFSTEENIQKLRDAFKAVMKKRPFRIEAIVILPDHIHCIWALPRDDSDFSNRWKEIKYCFSMSYISSFLNAYSKRKKNEKGLWQRRFWEHLIRDQEDYNRHFDYIHYNPVKHKLTERAVDWPYSTFRRFVDKGIYEEDWGSTTPASIKAMELE